MPNIRPEPAAAVAEELTVPERVLLFLHRFWNGVGPGWRHRRNGYSNARQGLIERDASDRLTLTKDGRAVLATLLGN